MPEKTNRLRKNARKVVVIVLALLIVLLAVYYLKFKNGVPVVTAVPAETRAISKTISATGETDVLEGQTKRALIAGSVSKINFKSGDTVKEGDVILQLDQASLKATLDTAYASYLSSKSTLDSYDQDLASAKASVSSTKRARDAAWREYMADNGEAAKQAYKTAEATYQSAVATLTSLENSKTYLETDAGSSYSSYISALNNYRNSVITSPADGFLALGNIYEGSYVTAGQNLFSVTNKNNLVFKAQVDEADVSHVTVDMPASINLDSYPSQPFVGKVARIDSKVVTLTDGGTVVYVDVAFQTSDFLPILGLNGSVDIEFEKMEDLVAIPINAVFEENDKKYVFVVSDSRTVKREVNFVIEGDEYAGLSSGVESGELVITEIANLKLKNGQKVSLGK